MYDISVTFLGSLPKITPFPPAQTALAWLLAQKSWIVPIPGTRKLHRLDEHLGAVNIELGADNLREIREAMANINVVGHWY